MLERQEVMDQVVEGLCRTILERFPKARGMQVIVDDHVLDTNHGAGPVRVLKENTHFRIAKQEAKETQ